ncbi:general substrate transporter [Punctularia strigosozonata HHB-11173 SS5]|uniref:General substrate transporter n=1 Tax=Punctularia strigosozonata (strain HHB-11173) TaxID=741275 RepID=R7S0Z2_PUNST|nr:general substrate transporter [Punctularia strigosozonata HHB-11173 SS5]EIN03883.1 general substrate transporter [Punctularia strigosozonata HHB-11173 SS5]
MVLSPKVYTWLCGLFAALGSVTFGYDLGIIASVLPSPNFLDTVGHPNDTQLGFITSCLLLGAFASNIYIGSLADLVGRRLSILAGCIVFLLGGAIQVSAQNIHYMYGGRFLAGMGIGMLAMLAPLYQAEIAHPSIRGRLTTLQQFMLGIGSFVASFIGYGCYHGISGQAQWRIPLGIQLVPAIPLAIFILLLPESPRYLAMKGRDDDALQILARLHAHGDTSDPFVVAEHREILDQIALEKLETRNAWHQLFFIPSNFRRLFLGVAIQFSVQMTGVSVIQYYSPTIFASIGIDTSTTLGLQSGNSVIALIGEALCVMYIDKFGRRPVYVAGNALSGFTFVIGTIIIALFPAGSNNPNASRAFVSMTWLFNLVFSACIGPLSWAVPVEMFNSATRAKATAITSSAAWISNFMIAQVTPVAFNNVGWKFYLVFAICGFSNALFFWALLPETRGIPLEELDAYFETVPLLVPGSVGATGYDASTRERELAQGRVFVHGKEDLERGASPEKGQTQQAEYV